MTPLFALMLLAQTPSTGLPPSLEKVGIDQNVGARLPGDARLTDHRGQQVALSSLYSGRPMILALVYYECPMLCTMVLNGVLRSLNVLELDVGRDFDVVTISIDPRETAKLAEEKRSLYLHKYRRPSAEQGWHFLVGSQEVVGEIAQTVGFHYVWDEQTEQYAHASGIMVLTPNGDVAQYFFGVDYDPTSLRLALVSASRGTLGNVVDAVMLYCFAYDPSTGQYSLAIMQTLRVGALLTLLALGLLIGTLTVRERRRRRAEEEGWAPS